MGQKKGGETYQLQPLEPSTRNSNEAAKSPQGKNTARTTHKPKKRQHERKKKGTTDGRRKKGLSKPDELRDPRARRGSAAVKKKAGKEHISGPSKEQVKTPKET